MQSEKKTTKRLSNININSIFSGILKTKDNFAGSTLLKIILKNLILEYNLSSYS